MSAAKDPKRSQPRWPVAWTLLHAVLAFAIFILLSRSGLINSRPTTTPSSGHCACDELPNSHVYFSRLARFCFQAVDMIKNVKHEQYTRLVGLASTLKEKARSMHPIVDSLTRRAYTTTQSAWHEVQRRLGGHATIVTDDKERLLSGTGTAEGCSSSSSSTSHVEGSHGEHPHDALLFLFNALIIGTVVLHMTLLPYCKHLQQTVALFLLGVLYSIIQEGFGLQDELGVLGRSYGMWMDIDPHLLLYTMLPVLLAGDAMCIDTQIARSVSNQCMYLAGPGVLIGSFMIAVFLYIYLPYNWSFYLCLVQGSILAATDPVAVVSLLKELGAAPALTMLIQGESLLNDGTAIVLYMLSYNLLKGLKYDFGEIIIFLVRTALLACGLGWIMGNVFCFWIRKANKRLEHHSQMIQVSLTICCAYSTFVIAETLKMSGVLCTVSASLVLADRMWTAVVHKHAVHHIWHFLEYIGNSLIFFLAGSLTGSIMLHTEFLDYLHLGVLYVTCMVIRAIIVFGSRPILGRLSTDKKPLPKTEAALITWGGLRGAVGLALAIQVKVDRVGGAISEESANRVLFFTGGIAALTLVVNATTCPNLVKALGITRGSEAKRKMLLGIHYQLQGRADAVETIAVRETLLEMLIAIKERINNTIDGTGGRSTRTHLQTRATNKIRDYFGKLPEGSRTNLELIVELDDSKERYRRLPKQRLRVLSEIPKLPFVDLQEGMKDRIGSKALDPSLFHAVNQAFLQLVKAEYWRLIEAGEFVEGTNHAEMLIESVSNAIRLAGSGVRDFEALCCGLGVVEADFPEVRSNPTSSSGMGELASCENLLQRSVRMSKTISELRVRQNKTRSKAESVNEIELPWIVRFTKSTLFEITTMAAIVANVLYIILEDRLRNSENAKHPIWFVMEVAFNIFFLGELLMKLFAQRLQYFKSPWNHFDFFLVVVGIIGLAFEIQSLEQSENADFSSEARLFRVNRVFRVMRILRAFRMIKFWYIIRRKLLNKDISFELYEKLRVVTVLTAYARAHTASQLMFMEFFGKDGTFASPEESWCILESQTRVYEAIALAAREAEKVNDDVLRDINIMRECNRVAEHVSDFIVSANDAGVLNVREAETILHPMRDRRREWYRKVKDILAGEVSLRVIPATPGEEQGEGSKTSVQISGALGCDSSAVEDSVDCSDANGGSTSRCSAETFFLSSCDSDTTAGVDRSSISADRLHVPAQGTKAPSLRQPNSVNLKSSAWKVKQYSSVGSAFSSAPVLSNTNAPAISNTNGSADSKHLKSAAWKVKNISSAGSAFANAPIVSQKKAPVASNTNELVVSNVLG